MDHIGNKVEHIGNEVDRDKLSNSSCCRFVAKTGNKVKRIRQPSTLLSVCCRFQQQSTFNKVDHVKFNFVASVYRALNYTNFNNLLLLSLTNRTLAMYYSHWTAQCQLFQCMNWRAEVQQLLNSHYSLAAKSRVCYNTIICTVTIFGLRSLIVQLFLRTNAQSMAFVLEIHTCTGWPKKWHHCLIAHTYLL